MFSPTQMLASDRVWIIGHRGHSAMYPENTLASAQAGLDAGADMIEIDYHESLDGELVVIHDATLARTTNATNVLGDGSHEVATTVWQDLQRLDAGSWKDASFSHCKIPSLAETLALVTPSKGLLIERKAGSAQNIVQLLVRHKAVAKVIVQAFDWVYLAQCRQHCPDLVTIALGRDALTQPLINDAIAAGVSGIGWRCEDLDESGISAARQCGLPVWSYTVNSAADAQRLVSWGLTGVITDHPQAAREWLAQ